MMAKRPKGSGPVHAIVPVNIPKKSKARLSTLLRPAERARLTEAMLAHVLLALRASRIVSSVTVVCADRAVRKIARKSGAQFAWEGHRRGLNKALRLAIRRCERRGAGSVLVVHADLPLVTSEEIDRFLIRSRGYPVALTPSKDGKGTNALFLKPPSIIRPAFGKDSFRRHMRLGKQKKIRCKILSFPGIRFDVDQPRDLRQLMCHRIRNETIRVLSTIRTAGTW